MLDMLETGKLDEHYDGLVRAADWLDRLHALGAGGAAVRTLREQLASQRKAVVAFYLAYFESRPVIGSAEAAATPDVLFVLGCRAEAELSARITAAARILQGTPRCLVLLSGGGFGARASEAGTMADALATAGIPRRRLLLEEESLDTVANAVFGKLTLRAAGRLPASGKVAVVTSAFHAVRTLAIFSRVFGAAYHVGVVAVPSPSADLEGLGRRAAKELDSDSRSSRDIFSFRDFFTGRLEDVPPGDDRTLFVQLLTAHDLYRHRWDLARKWGVQ
jgi:uncharacterized SAM-binding protein YcdF (DUF218 family)